MMDITKQIELGLLVCPESKSHLTINRKKQNIENKLKTKSYSLFNGTIPILLTDEIKMEEYASSSERMNEEYLVKNINSKKSLLNRFKTKITSDYRTKTSISALKRLFEDLPSNALCLSIGGGPTRANQKLTNINIGPFPNVDVVADAHCLPYADDSVDVIHSEAVLEHLHTPAIAVKEMFRVMKKNGKAYVCTPFLQPYHGYPHHYQGFTLTGHVHLFESVGFRVLESGPCVGPIYTLMSMGEVFIKTYIPSPLSNVLKFGWGLLSAVIRPLDLIVGNKANAHIMASTTYLIAEKIG